MEKLFPGINNLFDNGIDLDLFKSYLNKSVATQLGRNFLHKISEEHDYVPKFNVHVSTRTILLHTSRFYLELEFIEPGQPEKIFVSKNNCKQVVGVLQGSANIRKFNPPSELHNFVSEESNSVLVSGEAAVLDDEYYVVDNRTNQHVSLLYITDLETLNKGSTVAAYRIATGKFSHLISGSLAASRIEMMVSIMGEMKYVGCSETVRRLSFDHPDYFVRWESIRTYLKVNPEQAQFFLEKIIETESHPHVLNAANKSLDLIRESLHA